MSDSRLSLSFFSDIPLYKLHKTSEFLFLGVFGIMLAQYFQRFRMVQFCLRIHLHAEVMHRSLPLFAVNLSYEVSHAV